MEQEVNAIYDRVGEYLAAHCPDLGAAFALARAVDRERSNVRVHIDKPWEFHFPPELEVLTCPSRTPGAPFDANGRPVWNVVRPEGCVGRADLEEATARSYASGDDLADVFPREGDPAFYPPGSTGTGLDEPILPPAGDEGDGARREEHPPSGPAEVIDKAEDLSPSTNGQTSPTFTREDFHEDLQKASTPTGAASDRVALLIKLYQEGAPFDEIERQTGIKKGSLYYHLEKHKIPRRGSPDRAAAAKERADKACALYSEGASLEQIKTETNLFDGPLYAELTKRGIPRREHQNRPGRPKSPPGDIATARRAIDAIDTARDQAVAEPAIPATNGSDDTIRMLLGRVTRPVEGVSTEQLLGCVMGRRDRLDPTAIRDEYKITTLYLGKLIVWADRHVKNLSALPRAEAKERYLELLKAGLEGEGS